MTVAELLSIKGRGIFVDDRDVIFHGDLIALDGGTGRILFDTYRSKKETVEKYSSGEVIALWADVRLCKGIAFGDYFKPVMKCYVSHDSWKKQEVEQ